MKPSILSVLLCSAAFAVAAPIDPATGDAKPTNPEMAAAGYKIAFSDEFNGTKLDEEKWHYRTDSKMMSTQLPANVRLANGHLVLDLKKEEAKGKHYTGGGVISKDAFKYGYYEARLKVAPGEGWHTSFWTMKHDGSGGTSPKAACQELDIIEEDSVRNDIYYVTVHKWKGEHIMYGGRSVKSTTNLSQDFHVYACEFTPQTVKYFFDGKLVRTTDVTKAPQEDGVLIDFEHGDQNIWLTSIASLMGSTKQVDESKLPATAEFDYVRFYTKD